jgi:hypothetical protein
MPHDPLNGYGLAFAERSDEGRDKGLRIRVFLISDFVDLVADL